MFSALRSSGGSYSNVGLSSHGPLLAAVIAESTGTRTLDALHLAAAVRFGPLDTFHTYDERQAAVARELGFEVVGAG